MAEPNIDPDDIEADKEYNGDDDAEESAPAVRVVFVLLGENDKHLDQMQEDVLREAERVGFLAEHVFVADLDRDDVPASSPLGQIIDRKQ